MKETVDSKTGVKELQPDEHVPVGPVRIAKSTPPRNPLDVMHERITTLETKLLESNAVHLKHLDTVNAIFTKYDAQIASLQQAVAAIERRQMPLVQASHDDCHNPNCDVCHPKA